MNIAFAASEMTPFVKTGGLADVIGALPIAMNNPGCDIRIFIPRYSSIDLKKHNLEEENFFKSFKIKIGTKSHTIKTFRTVIPKTKISVFFVDCPSYYDRDDIYTSDRDEDERFILFNRAVLEIMQRLKWAPDLIHCHDWQAGLIPFYIKENYAWDKLFKNTKTIFTIHNIGYQGLFPVNGKANGKPQTANQQIHDLANNGLYKGYKFGFFGIAAGLDDFHDEFISAIDQAFHDGLDTFDFIAASLVSPANAYDCLLYTSPSPRDP